MPFTLKPQEFAFDDPRSRYHFDQAKKPLMCTRGANDTFGLPAILGCLVTLQTLAKTHGGIDYLQVFLEQGTGRRLWFIEDDDGGAITALLPDEY